MTNLRKYLTENISSDERIDIKKLSPAQYEKVAKALARTKTWSGQGDMMIFYLTQKGKADNIEDEVRLVLHKNGKWELVGDLMYLK